MAILELKENLAFKAETPGVKESDMKALNMGRLKEHLSTQDSKAKEEDAAAGSGQAVASGEVVLPGVCFTMSLFFALCTVFTKCNKKISLVIVFGLIS